MGTSIVEGSWSYKDKLDQKLLHRPKPEELVKSGILKRKLISFVAVSAIDHPTLQRRKLLPVLDHNLRRLVSPPVSTCSK